MIPVANSLHTRAASAEFVEKIPIAFARRHLMLGLASDGDRLSVAVTSPVNFDQLQIVSRFLKRRWSRSLLPKQKLSRRLTRHISSARGRRKR